MLLFSWLSCLKNHNNNNNNQSGLSPHTLFFLQGTLEAQLEVLQLHRHFEPFKVENQCGFLQVVFYSLEIAIRNGNLYWCIYFVSRCSKKTHTFFFTLEMSISLMSVYWYTTYTFGMLNPSRGLHVYIEKIILLTH